MRYVMLDIDLCLGLMCVAVIRQGYKMIRFHFF